MKRALLIILGIVGVAWADSGFNPPAVTVSNSDNSVRGGAQEVKFNTGLTVTRSGSKYTVNSTGGTGGGIVSPGTFSWRNDYGVQVSSIEIPSGYLSDKLSFIPFYSSTFYSRDAYHQHAQLNSSLGVGLGDYYYISSSTGTPSDSGATGGVMRLGPGPDGAYFGLGNPVTGPTSGFIAGTVNSVSGLLSLSNGVDVSSTITLSGSAGTNGQVLTSGGVGALPTWTTVSGGGGGSSPLEVMVNGARISSPTATVAFSSDFTGSLVAASTASIGFAAQNGTLKTLTSSFTVANTAGILTTGPVIGSSATFTPLTPTPNQDKSGAVVVDNTLNQNGFGLVVYSSAPTQTVIQSLLYLKSDTTSYNEPLLYTNSNSSGTIGGQADWRLDSNNPDIEFVNKNMTAQGINSKFEIAMPQNADYFQINGRNASNTSFQNIVRFYRAGSTAGIAGGLGYNALYMATTGQIQLGDGGDAHYVALKASNTVAANLLFTLPAADGTSGQALLTDGNKTLYFGTVSGSGSGGYALEPATVTIQANKGITASTATLGSAGNAVYISSNLAAGATIYSDGRVVTAFTQTDNDSSNVVAAITGLYNAAIVATNAEAAGVYGHLISTGSNTATGAIGDGFGGLAEDTQNGQVQLAGVHGVTSAQGHAASYIGVLGDVRWQSNYQGGIAGTIITGLQSKVTVQDGNGNNVSSGTVASLFLPAKTGSGASGTSWAAYSADTDPSYFTGSVGVGTSAPSYGVDEQKSGIRTTYGLIAGSVTTNNGFYYGGLRVVTATATLTVNDSVVLSSGIAGNNMNVTLTLPSANSKIGQSLTVIKVDNSSSSVTLVTAGNDLIVTTTTLKMYAPGQRIKLVSDGQQLWIPDGPLPYQQSYLGYIAEPNTAAAVATSSNTQYCPITVTEPVWATGLRYSVGATGGAKIDAGIVAQNGAKLASSGATSIAGTGIQTTTFTSGVALLPGVYYYAITLSNTTATLTRFGTGGSNLGCAFETGTTGTIPTTATLTGVGAGVRQFTAGIMTAGGGSL